MTIEQAIELAIQHQHAGRLSEAEAIYRQALAVDPNHADALHLMATLGLAHGDWESARKLAMRAIAQSPDVAAYHCTLGDALFGMGELEQSVAAYRRAVELRPGFIEAENNLGVTLGELGRADEAIAVYRNILQNHPENAGVLCNLSQALLGQGRYDESLEAAQRASAIDPDLPDAQNNVGAAQFKQGQFDEAMSCFDRAIALRHVFPLAHMYRGMVLLLRGDLERGWSEYQWRLQIPGVYKFGPIVQPQWTGEDLNGRTIFLHAEQGFGDTIQFSRYAPLVAQRGGRVILGCQPELKRLLSDLNGVDSCVTPAEPLPQFHFHCPLMSLPLLFQTRVESIPATIPYLKSDPNSSFRILHSSFPQIGLVWSGRKDIGVDPARSLRLDDLAPLRQVPGVQFHSLQKGYAAVESIDQSWIKEWNSQITDFADTAALIQNLDLVITVDTAVGHLAGALGKPVWVLIAYVPDWRWMLEREDSPWYPTMKVFRQPAPGNWAEPIRRVVERLAKFKDER